jgi:hypothetical protein
MVKKTFAAVVAWLKTLAAKLVSGSDLNNDLFEQSGSEFLEPILSSRLKLNSIREPDHVPTEALCFKSTEKNYRHVNLNYNIFCVKKLQPC